MRIEGGGDARSTTPEPEHIREIYAVCRRTGVATIVTAPRTFREHMEFDSLIAGPWEWRLKDDIPYGDAYLYDVDGKRIGTVTVSSLMLQ